MPTLEAALQEAPDGCVLFILADGYPYCPITLSEAQWQQLTRTVGGIRQTGGYDSIAFQVGVRFVKFWPKAMGRLACGAATACDLLAEFLVQPRPTRHWTLDGEGSLWEFWRPVNSKAIWQNKMERLGLST